MLLKNLIDPRYYYVRRRQIAPYVQARLDHWMASLGLSASENYRRLAALKDIHRGKRAFFIGNGPSLRVEDLSALRGEITFASNKIYLAFGATDWRPTYYTVTDTLVAENNREEIARQDLTKIFSIFVKPCLGSAPNALYFCELAIPHRRGRPYVPFGENFLQGAYGGATVLYAQLQLAYFMGIREGYLIGTDFRFQTPSGAVGNSFSGKVILGAGERNHFHKDYRKPGEKWTVPQLDLQRMAFASARQAYEQAGGALYNASRQTDLDVLPRVSFDSLGL